MTSEKHRPTEEWEKTLHAELTGLPDRQAPATLIPRVMDRIKAAASVPWYQRAWLQWPPLVRVASGVGICALVAVLIWLPGQVWDANVSPQVVAEWQTESLPLGSYLNEKLESLFGSGAAFWGKHGQIILIGVAALLLATYLTCVAAGTAVYRLAWRRTI